MKPLRWSRGPRKRYDGDHFSGDDILLNQRRLAPGVLSGGISDQNLPSCIVFGTMGGELQVMYQRAYAVPGSPSSEEIFDFD